MNKSKEKIIEIKENNRGLVQRFLDGIPNIPFKTGDGSNNQIIRTYGNISLISRGFNPMKQYKENLNQINGLPIEKNPVVYLRIDGSINESLEKALKYFAEGENLDISEVDKKLKNYISENKRGVA